MSVLSFRRTSSVVILYDISRSLRNQTCGTNNKTTSVPLRNRHVVQPEGTQVGPAAAHVAYFKRSTTPGCATRVASPARQIGVTQPTACRHVARLSVRPNGSDSPNSEDTC